jgi:polysaccharide deacetylase family protein (PEP-CTERM system associated)
VIIVINALVIDLEHWHCIELLRNCPLEDPVDQVPEAVRPILNLLDKYETKATFAILGTVAKQHPELVEEIYSKGHEIASHAWSHKTLYELGKDGFEEEVKKSVKILKYITGEGPIGFRAPSFSIDNSTKWALDILVKYGFKYDASIFPIKTGLYGMPNACVHIYRPSADNLAEDDPFGKIVEFPMTVMKMGVNIPISGGFYLRLLPIWFLKYAIRKVNKERPVIIYIHPWETYIETPKVKLPLFSMFVTYYGIESALSKLEALLAEFKFKPVKYVLNSYGMY